MRRLILVAAFSCGAAWAARADAIRCTFTEPFIVTTYSIDRGEMAVEDDSVHTKKVLRGLSLHVFRSGLFEIRDAAGSVILHLEMTMKGSDGMSDSSYPYDVAWPRRNLRGGCVSEHLPLIAR